MIPIICVTGKMASGKNVATEILRAEGFFTIDADDIIHKTIEKLSNKIATEFSDDANKKGITLLNDDDSLNRRALGKLVFSNSALLLKQEKIVYPEFIKYIEEQIATHLNSARNDENVSLSAHDVSTKGVVINAAVLYKTPQLLKQCSLIIFITAPFFQRFFRAKRRDKISSCQILKRFKSQKSLYKEFKKTGIPIIKIRNSGSKKRLTTKIKRALLHF